MAGTAAGVVAVVLLFDTFQLGPWLSEVATARSELPGGHTVGAVTRPPA